MDLSDYEVPRVLVTCRKPIPFKRRVFSSSLDGQPIRGKHVEALINSEAFKNIDDNDVVSATQPTDEVDKKSYSLTGFLWAFKTWILESFRAATNDYYTRYHRHPRIVAWSLKNKFYLRMLRPFLHGQLPVERLVPDGIEAGSRWQTMEKTDDMYSKMSMFMEDMRGGPVLQANKEPIIADQHCGISELSGFQSYQGGPSSFHTLAKSNHSLIWQRPQIGKHQLNQIGKARQIGKR
ncbi:hypothetical protein Tco_1267132 [Tanacetum coccineum]